MVQDPAGCADHDIGPALEVSDLPADRLATVDWHAGGAPPVGTILSYPYYGDRGLWMTEEEFNVAVQANGGR